MLRNFFALFFVIIALILAILASLLSQDRLTGIIYFSRFFDIMLPVLAVGALIKYLFSRSCDSKNYKTTTVDSHLGDNERTYHH